MNRNENYHNTYISKQHICIIVLYTCRLRRHIHQYVLRKRTSIALRKNAASLWNASVFVEMRTRRHNYKPRYICMRANEKLISTTIPSRIQQKVRQETKRRESKDKEKKKKEKPAASLVNIRSMGRARRNDGRPPVNWASVHF